MYINLLIVSSDWTTICPFFIIPLLFPKIFGTISYLCSGSIRKAFLANLARTLSVSVSSIASILTHTVASKILMVTSTSFVSLGKFYSKLFFIVSNTTTGLFKQMYATFNIISATIASLTAAVFPVLGAVVRYTFIADFKERVTSLYKSRVELADSRKRSKADYKNRNVIINPGNKKEEK